MSMTNSREIPKHCKGCIYRVNIGAVTICDYAIETGTLRNCPVDECPYKVVKKGKRKSNVQLV